MEGRCDLKEGLGCGRGSNLDPGDRADGDPESVCEGLLRDAARSTQLCDTTAESSEGKRARHDPRVCRKRWLGPMKRGAMKYSFMSAAEPVSLVRYAWDASGHCVRKGPLP